MRSPRALAVAAAAVAAFAAGCRHVPPGSRPVPECPGALVSTADMGEDFLWRARVRVTAGGRSSSLQLVAQKRGDELLLLGLHPLGMKLFTLTQRGGEVQVDALPPTLLDVPPRNLLRDLHRIRFLPPRERGGALLETTPPPSAGGAGARVSIDNPACGVRSEYVTLSEGSPS
jgi:hypothetical protein